MATQHIPLGSCIPHDEQLYSGMPLKAARRQSLPVSTLSLLVLILFIHARHEAGQISEYLFVERQRFDLAVLVVLKRNGGHCRLPLAIGEQRNDYLIASKVNLVDMQQSR